VGQVGRLYHLEKRSIMVMMKRILMTMDDGEIVWQIVIVFNNVFTKNALDAAFIGNHERGLETGRV
jgi:hypothetical protein